MWYAFGGLAALLYLVLIFTLGVTTLRKGHWVMFILGIFLPLVLAHRGDHAADGGGGDDAVARKRLASRSVA